MKVIKTKIVEEGKPAVVETSVEDVDEGLITLLGKKIGYATDACSGNGTLVGVSLTTIKLRDHHCTRTAFFPVASGEIYVATAHIVGFWEHKDEKNENPRYVKAL